MQRRLASSVLCLLLLACAPGDNLDERIPVQPGGLLEVDLDLGQGLRLDPGSLEVGSHDADEVWIVADTSGWGASGVKFRVDHNGDTVRLYGRVGGPFSWMFGGPHVQVRVWVPREFSADLRCSAGPIRIEDLSGRIRARTRGGAIELVGSEGSIKLRTTDGSVRVTEVQGDVDIRASGGEIEVSWVTGSVEARTARGRVSVKHVDGRIVARSDRGEIELKDVSGEVDAKTERGAIFASFVNDPKGLLETRRGSVEVVCPEHAGFELDARSSRGTVTVSERLELQGEQSDDHVVAQVNGGGQPLHLYTARGSIRVSER